MLSSPCHVVCAPHMLPVPPQPPNVAYPPFPTSPPRLTWRELQDLLSTTLPGCHVHMCMHICMWPPMFCSTQPLQAGTPLACKGKPFKGENPYFGTFFFGKLKTWTPSLLLIFLQMKHGLQEIASYVCFPSRHIVFGRCKSG